MMLYPEGETERSEGYLLLFLQAAAENLYAQAVVDVCLLDNNGEPNYESSFTYTYHRSVGYGFPKYIKKVDLLVNKCNLLPQNKLTIVCNIIADIKIESYKSEKLIKQEKPFPVPNELEILWKNGNLTDVKLITSDNELKAHKLVLAASSPVFLAMFESNFKEKESSTIEFTDCDTDVLNEMLRFLYTGRAENIKKYSRDLVLLADKYDIKNLKLLCEEVLKNELSIENSIDLLILADCYNCSTLKPQVLKYVTKHAEEITKTAQFKVLQKDLPPLVVDIIMAMAK